MKLRKTMEMFRKHKIITSLVLVIFLTLISVRMFNGALAEAASFTEVPVAGRYLKSNTLIDENDIRYINVPSYIVLDSVITDSEEIVGKYVDTYDSLASGSLFYEELLVDADSIDNAYLFELANGEVAISIDADVKSSYANSILVGQFIDLYYLGKSDNDSFDHSDLLVYGELVSNARVIAVKDKNGGNIDADNELNTNVVVVALNQEDAHIVQLAKAIGEVSLVISYDNINMTNTNNYYNKEKIRKIIEQQAIAVENQTSEMVTDNEPD